MWFCGVISGRGGPGAVSVEDDCSSDVLEPVDSRREDRGTAPDGPCLEVCHLVVFKGTFVFTLSLCIHCVLSRKEWVEQDIVTMSDRIISMRKSLRDHLENKLKSAHSWQHVTDQIGMFCFTGLDEAQCDKLMKEHSIYLTRNGRISIAGLNTMNVERVANAIHEVSK